jgi:hypothetical protein
MHYAYATAHPIRSPPVQPALTVCKGHGAGRDDLQHLKHVLGARVKLLCSLVHLHDALIILHVSMNIMRHTRQSCIPEALEHRAN